MSNLVIGGKNYDVTDDVKKQVEKLLKDKDQKEINELEDFVGEIVFIRTVTNYYTGRVNKIIGKFIKLDDACWIPDTGRFMEFMQGNPTDNLETEPMGTTLINIDSIIDLSLYSNMFAKQV